MDPPRVWTSQPQYLVPVKPPLAETGFVFVGGILSDPYTKKLWTLSSGATAGVASFGRVVFPGTSASGVQQSAISTAAQTKCTFIGVFRIDTAKQYSFLCRSSSTNASFSIGNGTGGNAGLAFGMQKSGVTNLDEVVLTAGVNYSFVASHDQGSGAYYFLAKNLADGSILRAAGTSYSASIAGDGTAQIGVNVSPNDFAGAVGLLYQAFDFLPSRPHRLGAMEKNSINRFFGSPAESTF